MTESGDCMKGWGKYMKFGILVLSAAVGFMGPVCTYGSPTEPKKQALDFMAGTQVWIEGNSSLRRYYLTAEGISAKSDLSTSDSEMRTLLSLILNRKGHQLVVALPVKSLKSGDPNMDQNAYEKLKAKDFPDIVFTMGDYTVKAYPGSLTTYALLVSGKLRIAGVEKDVVLEPTMVLGKDGIRIYGTQDIYQKEYGISPYSVAVVMTTDDKVVVHYMIALGLKQKRKAKVFTEK
jgi:hypothetical protein